jgi:outer membrane protein OmpA-like peptidoglycan-associated protein
MRAVILFFILLMNALPAFALNRCNDTKPFYSLNGGQLQIESIMRRYDILFDLNKTTFRPETRPILDSIAAFIRNHPEYTFEIGMHTDYESNEMSMRLTSARARAIRDYFVQMDSIPATQLIHKGYGHSQKLKHDTAGKKLTTVKLDSLKRLNRRAEFKIVAINPNLCKTFTLQDSVFDPGMVMRTYSISWNLDKSDLRKESYPLLDSIVVFMNKHPNVKLEIGHHTDSRNSESYSTQLCCMRARTIVDYLVSKGIATERLTAMGYGETCLLIPDSEVEKQTSLSDRERLHQMNRRTELKISFVR